MLPPFIIDQIRRREDGERRRQDREQPRVELPIQPPRSEPAEKDEERDRGVMILDLG